MSVSIARILQQTALTQVTRDGYHKRLTHLVKGTGKPIEWIMQNPDAVMTWMNKNIGDNGAGVASLATYSTAVCKLFSIHPDFKAKNKNAYTRWAQYLALYTKKRTEMYENNDLTPRQRENMVLSEEIKQAFCKLSDDPEVNTNLKLNLHRLLFAVFLNIRPKRADLGNVWVSRDGTIPAKYAKLNYIHLNAKQPLLVLNTYKTAGMHGNIKEPLPLELVAIIKESLELFPRDHLFVWTRKNKNNPNEMHPYDLNDSYGKFVRRAFEQHFGKAMGVSLWRRVYVGENVDFRVMSFKELKENAKLMGHTVLTQLLIYKSSGDQVARRAVEDIGKPISLKCKA